MFLEHELIYTKKRNPKLDLLVGDSSASTASYNRSPSQIKIWYFMVVYPKQLCYDSFATSKTKAMGRSI